MDYVYLIPGKGNLTFKYFDQEIWAESIISFITAQELIDGIREAEEVINDGINFTQIALAAGKDALTRSISIGITVTLLENWKIYSQKTSGAFTVQDGNIIRHDATVPFKNNPGITYQQILTQSAVVATISTGSGLSVDEHNKLMGLPTSGDISAQVWATPTSSETTSGTFGTWIKSLLTKLQFIAGS